MRRLKTCRVAGALIVTALAVSAGGCTLTSDSTRPVTAVKIPASPSPSDAWHYALVIDASSSASTLEVFQWRSRAGRLPRIEPAPFPAGADTKLWELKVTPGLGAYAGRPGEAVRSIEPLLDFALDKLGTDPTTLSRTSLFLRATAGMRLLPQNEQTEILSALGDYFETLPLAQSSARVISGREEGIYGWIAVNFLLGHLDHGGPFPTVGALDLGGASTQITFAPLDFPQHLGQAVTIGDNNYHLYTHSYLGLGQDQAREGVDSPDCFIRGYPLADGRVGTGDFDSCRTAVRSVFMAPCETKSCSLFGVYQPPLYGDFLAFSVYAYAADFFGLNEQLVPAALAEQGVAFCARNWDEMVAVDPDLADNRYVPNYCYAAAHIVTLLTDGFGFSEATERISAPLRVQGSKVGWSLGALVYELAGSSD